MPTPRTGGSFAPPITDAKLAGYKDLAKAAEPQVRDAMNALVACVDRWWKLPESKGVGRAHASGRGTVVDLDPELAEELDESIPWRHELEMYAKLFEGIDAQNDKALRNAAFHLLWVANELELGREPMTADKL